MTQIKTKERVRRDPEQAKSLILDTTVRLMQEEGYAAVSSRRIAKEAGITAALVHYYYPATDDVFVAVFNRMTGRQMAKLESLMEGESSLESLWQYQADWVDSALGSEFIALTNHRKSIAPLIAQAAEQARRLHSKVVARALEGADIDQTLLPPVAISTIITGLARILSSEQANGITLGHKEVNTFLKWAMQRAKQSARSEA